MKSLLLFLAGSLLFGAAALSGGYAVWGLDSLRQGAAAFGLAFLPAAVAFAWVIFSYRKAPELQLLASLGGSGVRMAIALGGGMFLTQSRPQEFEMPFWAWLVLFYLTFLGFEIFLLVRQQPKLNGSPQG